MYYGCVVQLRREFEGAHLNVKCNLFNLQNEINEIICDNVLLRKHFDITKCLQQATAVKR